MGKKKKANRRANDARGYQQGGGTASCPPQQQQKEVQQQQKLQQPQQAVAPPEPLTLAPPPPPAPPAHPPAKTKQVDNAPGSAGATATANGDAAASGTDELAGAAASGGFGAVGGTARKKRIATAAATATSAASLASAAGGQREERLEVVTVTASVQRRLEDLRSILLQEEEDGGDGSGFPAEPAGEEEGKGPSSRFRGRVGGVYDRLVLGGNGNGNGLGFDVGQVEEAARALGYGVANFEATLNWLCLHVPTEHLPPILTEGAVRDAARDGAGADANSAHASGAAITVLPAAAAAATRGDGGGDRRDAFENTVPLSAFDTLKREGAEDEKALAERKAWLLQQYQYEGDDDKKEEVDGEAKSSPEMTQSQQQLQQQQQQQQQEQQQPPSSPLELELLKLRKELEEVEADAKDEASSYMRSKAENRELQKMVRQLRQQLTGCERRVQRERAEISKKQKKGSEGGAATAPTVAQEEGEEGAGFGLSLFGGGPDDEEDTEETPPVVAQQPDAGSSTTQATADDSPVVIEFPDNAIPSSWTGKTPRRILEEHCRKHKLQRPKYEKVACNGSCFLRIGRDLVVEQPGGGSQHARKEYYLNLQEYVATKMLYKLSSDLPLYQLFPSFFRDLWKSWLEEEKQLQLQADQATEAHRQKDIELVIRAAEEGEQSRQSRSPRKPAAAISANKALEEKKAPQPEADIESWEDRIGDGTDENTETTKATAGSRKNRATSKRADVRRRSAVDFGRRTESSEYKRMLKQRRSLPIYSYKEEILDTIDRNAVTILCAETGAGKTTQCPQFLLEDALLNGKAPNIICTQPRRVAATSVAERVSEEMCEKSVGGLVGYSIRLESRQSSDTKLLFATTGVVLRRLVDDPTLKGISHVLVDEVHERQWQIDVLLISLRNLLNTSRPDLKVILMSATLDAELFCKFFHGAPLVSVPGRTFPVAKYYLEDLIEATGHIIEEGSRCARRDCYARTETATLAITTRGGEKRNQTVSLESEVDVELSQDFLGYSRSTRWSMDIVDETAINYDLLEDILRLVLVKGGESKQSLAPPEGADLSHGSVLIFLPGLGEIRALMERLEGSRIFGKSESFDIIPMHSSLSSRDQKRAFRAPPKGCRKIVISTNICETSVTIPDVVCVIDCGRVRELQNDKRTSTPKLVPTWCSRASTKQRAGRAGRVQPGLCLKLFSSRTEKYSMSERGEPELKRIPLEEVCLNILAAGMARNCKDFLCQAPQPPSVDAVNAALDKLSEIGAVQLPLSDQRRRIEGGNEVLTPLGRHLSRLPVDVHVGKMLIFGALFKCIEPIAIIAASLSASQSVFSASIQNSPEQKAAHASFRHPHSDFLTFVNVFKAYQKAEASGEARKLCRKKYLNFNALREINDARQLYADLLCGIRLMDRDQLGRDNKSFASSPYNVNGSNESVIHSVVFSGVYPNIGRVVIPTSTANSNKPQTLVHRNERLEVHSSSVNAKVAPRGTRPSLWVAFHEKFGTGHRVSVTTTCFVDPFSIMLFGSSLEVFHLQRKVRVDGWIELSAAAKTGVTFAQVRRHVNWLLKTYIEGVDSSSPKSASSVESKVSVAVDALVGILTDSSSS